MGSTYCKHSEFSSAPMGIALAFLELVFHKGTDGDTGVQITETEEIVTKLLAHSTWWLLL